MSVATIRKSSEQLAKMRAAGRVVAEMHDSIREAIRPGITTLELDAIGRDVLDRRGARSNFLNYHGFPAVICTSPNDMIVHGIPGSYRLKDGDIISIDCGAIIDGWHGDTKADFLRAVGEALGFSEDDAAEVQSHGFDALADKLGDVVAGDSEGWLLLWDMRTPQRQGLAVTLPTRFGVKTGCVAWVV